MTSLQNHDFWMLPYMPEIQNDGRHAVDKFISIHELTWLSMTPLNEITTATPIFPEKMNPSALKRYSSILTGRRKCNTVDAKQVIYIQINVPKCLLQNKVVTKFQRLPHGLEISEVKDTYAETANYKRMSGFQDGSH